MNRPEDYDKEHARCPRCGNRRVWCTTAGILHMGEGEYVDTNQAACDACGWIGVAHDLKPDATQEGQA